MQYITIMTPEEYDQFRDFLKQRSTLEANVAKAYEALLSEHFHLCRLVSAAVAEGQPICEHDIRLIRRFTINSHESMAQAMDVVNRKMKP